MAASIPSCRFFEENPAEEHKQEKRLVKAQYALTKRSKKLYAYFKN